MNWFLFLWFDMDFLFMIDHLSWLGGLLCINFLFWKFLNDCQCCCLLFIVLCLRSGQFLFLLINIQLFVLFLLQHFHVYWRFLNWFLCWFLTEVLHYCQRDLRFVVFIHLFEAFVDILLLLFHMLVVHCHCYSFRFSLHSLLGNGFLWCTFFLDYSRLLGCI